MDLLKSTVLGVLDKRTLHFVSAVDYPDNLSAFANDDYEDVTADNMRCIGSYCWVDAHTPTIVVPGMFSLFCTHRR
jgi:hypothetical protein